MPLEQDFKRGNCLHVYLLQLLCNAGHSQRQKKITLHDCLFESLGLHRRGGKILIVLQINHHMQRCKLVGLVRLHNLC